MNDLILHHYSRSPYAELVRRALGIKGARWHSVTIPNMAPKPELTPLTGGYRKTPVLQIGADIYCDTAIAIDAIEAFHPAPSLFPAPLGRVGALIAMQAGGATFGHAVGSAMAVVADQIDDAFFEDRKKLFGMDRDRMIKAAPHQTAQFMGWLARLEDALSDGRTFLGGDAPGYADCAAGMNVWFQGHFGLTERRLAPFPHVAAWSLRCDAVGHGERSVMTAQDALDVAKAATPTASAQIDDGCGFVEGQMVAIRTEDPGADTVTGSLLRCTARDIVLLRDDPRVGTVAVHFPRIGQILRAA